MKSFLIILLLLPVQIAMAQYSDDAFTLNRKDVPIEQESIGLTIQKDTVISLGLRGSIFGLSVTGTAVLENDQDSYVRVILRDDHNYEYLIYECFPLLTETLTPQFRNISLETKSLDGITPLNIRVELKDARIVLDAFSYVPESEAAKQSVVNSAVIQKEQTRRIVDILNRNLAARDMTWRAGVTSMAEKSFEEKKSMFGGDMPQLYGFDYYIGGIYVMPGSYSEEQETIGDRSTTYVSEWDWRNRHGRNWITNVKDQYNCNSCWVFSSLGTIESYINLYYNNPQISDYDLSEEEIISCVGSYQCNQGNSQQAALNYVKQNTVVLESCFPYTGSVQSCSNKCQNPTERISIGNYQSFNNSLGEGYIKQQLFKNPIMFGVNSWNHFMVLCGYKTIQVGDVIQIGKHTSVTINTNQHASMIGKTAWLLKNSWGDDWGDNGLAYVYVDLSDIYGLIYLTGQIASIQYGNSDIKCEDRDGDGYYFWGIGNKLASWPSWIPDSIDGNDNNYQKGKTYLDTLHVMGELETINPNGISTLTINSNTTYTTRQYKHSHIVVSSNKTLTVKSILNMFGRPTITVQSGGQLIVDGGVITNAYLNLASGAKLELKNGGKIVMRTNTSFSPPLGALVDITHGEIIRSNDF